MENKKKIWLVMGNCGEYSDYREWVVCWAEEQTQAEAIRDSLKTALDKLRPQIENARQQINNLYEKHYKKCKDYEDRSLPEMVKEREELYHSHKDMEEKIWGDFPDLAREENAEYACFEIEQWFLPQVQKILG